MENKQTVPNTSKLSSALNNKEFKIIKLVACGLTSSEIAQIIGYSIATIDIMKSKVLQKIWCKKLCTVIFLGCSKWISNQYRFGIFY
jgi:DNA-binding NarL/FixJ family response regulator